MRTSKGIKVAAVTTALLATAFAGTASAQAPQRSALTIEIGKPSQQRIAALFSQWNAALATGSPSTVADLYARNAVLLPTVSNEVRTDRARIVNYFETFLAKKPSGRILSSTITVLDNNSATNNGTYRFSFADGSTVDARFTYVYEKVGGRWLIVTHHSSAMPEK
ncbi:SgcJ/EcaC family oxidoreductase [Allokutzneria sp. A3M-2-11 16]|uniref:SgcJ/EcaC family oxidoreductase n=1 Tax=Allokutzneria sp. A3M-2-11 16 TaxID=2962043 RepID=UPI0020B842D6|nr:SgcJ/EcaC family oxidoreductase [Allokutzneria sp. A3M-2-11 16]MCP3802206.1 SgcJ/EcaC family oxidoreductase [Allokutzneria sp. A3M-2-11 16]